MKTLILSSAIALSLTSTAFADRWEQRATVEDHYTTQNVNTTSYEQVCQNVTIQNRNSPGEGALLGMIIGGALGDALSHGDGDRTAAGAVIGGVIGANRSNNQPSTRTETRCENVPVTSTQQQTVYTHSTIRFYHNGKWQTLRFQR